MQETYFLIIIIIIIIIIIHLYSAFLFLFYFFYFISFAQKKKNKQTEKTLAGTPQQLWPITAGSLIDPKHFTFCKYLENKYSNTT